MRILYDGTIYSMQKAGGINRYFANLIGRLPDTVYPRLVVETVNGLNFPSHQNLRIHSTKQLDFRPRRISRRLQRWYTSAVTSSERFDIVHPTYYTSLTCQSITNFHKPVVLTVYDMIHELFPNSPDLADPSGSHAAAKRSAILAAQAIICISENTKRDLLHHYSIPEDRITVTPLASEIDTTQAHGPETVPASPYFLYVGSRSSYKNFNALLSAFARLASAHPDAALCVVGPSFTEAEGHMLAELNIINRVQHYGQVSDSQLAKLYRCSLAFVYPSLYEGFGIPPLEAMACGTLVIAADRSSIPEVVGDAGLLFNPDSSCELTETLFSVIEDPGSRDARIQKGFKRAKMFSWEQTVEQTVNVYRTLSPT